MKANKPLSSLVYTLLMITIYVFEYCVLDHLFKLNFKAVLKKKKFQQCVDTMFVTFQTVPGVIIHQLWITLQLSQMFQHRPVRSSGFTASKHTFWFLSS